MKNLFIYVLSLSLFSCATKKVEEHTQDELNHYVLNMALVGPAIQNAIGNIKKDTFNSATRNLGAEDAKNLMLIFQKAFSPIKAYKRIHRRALQTISKDDTVTIVKKMNSDTYHKFSEKLMELYKAEGYERVVQAMRDLDDESMGLNMDKAYLAEQISRSSMNFNVLNILFTKMGGGSQIEELLYRQSMFVLTYLAIEDFEEEEIKEILEVRQDPIWLKYQEAFEQSIGQSYDDFFFELRRYQEGRFSS